MRPFKEWYMRIKGWFRSTGTLPKGIRLVETVEPTVEQRGDFILVIRGALNRLVGRESQLVQDDIRVDEVGTASASLTETQQSQDEISYTTADVTEVTLSESQPASDAVTYTESPLDSRRLGEIQDSSDSISYTTANAVQPTELSESQPASDSISYSEATLIVVNLTESQPSTDSIGSSEATREVWRFGERQYTHEIPVAYVPSGNETLEIRALTEVQYASDDITATELPAQKPFDASYWSVWYVEIITTQLSESQSSTDYITYYETISGTAGFGMSEWYAEYV